MKENDLVVMPIFIACRDPAAYPNPHEADLERKTQMLSFATGPHLCLGMHLARREIRIAIETFLDRSTTSTSRKASTTPIMPGRLSMSIACR